MEDYYYRYKCLLEYFVTHLEYVQTKSENIVGYKKYIEPILNSFIVTGLGYNDQAIQSQISNWANYGKHKLCINVTCSFGSYMTNQCYLNWNGTWLNTRPIWNKAKQIITGLYLSKQEKASAKSEMSFSLSELGLFDDMAPNENLKKFFDTFETLIVNKEKHEAMIEYANLLKSNKNLILTGAPGTGKTYLAKLIAKEFGATEENHQCKMVQFHPSYDYTDFVEGLRPIQKEGESNIGFELKRGAFKDFCAQALENLIDSRKSRQDINEEKLVERKNFVFIIDEINRGEISKIFGELFFSIDPGYRGETGRIQTQYQNLIEDGDMYEDGFYVPENVYIIGTMNDIDRSVDSMDFAMRRRFAWKEIKATDRIEMLDELSDLKNEAIDKMVNLNMAIEKTEGLNSSYHIGPAYFRKVMLYKDNPDTMWSYLWDYHIKGVLYEYVRGTEDVDIKMTAFEKAYNNK